MINAISMSTKVGDMLQDKNIEGCIHSVFDHSFNIQLPDNHLLGILSTKYNDNPYSITIDLKEDQRVRALPIKQGMKVVINKRGIRSLIGGFYINLENTKKWEPSIPEKIEKMVDKGQLETNIKIIYKTLINHGKFLGIGPVIFKNIDINESDINRSYTDIEPNHYSTFILPRIEELMYGLEQGDKVLIGNILRRIVGFGPGLTPSADDMLVGIMAAFHYLGRYIKEEIPSIAYLKETLDQECISQTTLVSQQMLKAAAEGQFSKAIKELCMSCISTTEEGVIRDNVLKAINLGSTSGTDTVAGFLIGYYIVNKKYLQIQIHFK